MYVAFAIIFRLYGNVNIAARDIEGLQILGGSDPEMDNQRSKNALIKQE